MASTRISSVVITAIAVCAMLAGCAPAATVPSDARGGTGSSAGTGAGSAAASRQAIASAEAQARRLPRSQRCLRIDRIDNWRVIDSRQLIVYGPRREQAWHLRLITTCTHLRMSEVVGFRAIGAYEICGDPGDEILVRGDRCPIRSMVPVSAAEVEMLFQEAKGHGDVGKLPPATHTTPEKTPQ